MKNIANLNQQEINKLLADAWLNISVDENVIYNPLKDFPLELQDEPQKYITWLLAQPEYMSFVCSEILRIDIFPMQGVLLKEIWNHKFPMLIASRGASKSSSLGIYSLLRMMLMPGRQVILCGAGFRQSKIIFEYMERIWNNSPILRDMYRGNYQGPQHGSDMWTFRLGESATRALPIGSGDRIRGLRAHDIIVDEFDAVNLEIFETVIAGFAAVSATPIESMKSAAKEEVIKKLGIKVRKKRHAVKYFKENQIVIAGTAGYEFNHFCKYWQRWKMFVETGGKQEELIKIFNGYPPEDFNWRDYAIIRIPIELVPKGFMDGGQIARSKATLHSGIFQMEFSAVFSKDSTGFFRRTLIESATAGPGNPDIEQFSPLIRGDKTKQYIYGIDPASESDKFAIVVLELNEDCRRIVYCWAANKKDFQERARLGVTNVTDFYGFCARKIRDLMKVFPCKRIAMDSQGGGHHVLECLHDDAKLQHGEEMIWKVIDPKKADPTDSQRGLHIVQLVNFADAKWTAEANHGLKSDFEHKRCVFPYKDDIDVAIAMADKELDKSMYDTLEDCIFDIEELKNELSYIVLTRTTTGREHWDTPEVKLAGTKKGRLKKDRYSALIIANACARAFDNVYLPPTYDTAAGWRGNKGEKLGVDEGPSFIGPSWAVDVLNNLY